MRDERGRLRLRLTFVSRLTFHSFLKRAENDADGRGSFAAVERSISDRVLAGCGKAQSIHNTPLKSY
jgi:hypothetical protein